MFLLEVGNKPKVNIQMNKNKAFRIKLKGLINSIKFKTISKEITFISLSMSLFDLNFY